MSLNCPSSLANLPIEGSSRVAPGRIGVLAADDSKMRCQLLADALRRSRYRFDVVACAVNRSEIIRSLQTQPVDVALINDSLQDGRYSGFHVLREVHASFPKARTVMLLDSSEREMVIDAFRAGAKGVFCRADPFAALCKCIQAVHNGQVWANSNELQFILDLVVNISPLRVADAQGKYLLSKREEGVVRLLVDGLSNRQIGAKLGLSEHTVSNYLFSMYNKLGVSSRVELILYVLSRRDFSC